MKQVKVTLTYVADVDDELEADYIHEKLEDCICQEIPMDVYDFLGEDSWHVRLKLQQTRTKIGLNSLVTIQKTED
jgi:hypothetical protein